MKLLLTLLPILFLAGCKVNTVNTGPCIEDYQYMACQRIVVTYYYDNQPPPPVAVPTYRKVLTSVEINDDEDKKEEEVPQYINN